MSGANATAHKLVELAAGNAAARQDALKLMQEQAVELEVRAA